MMFIIQSVYMYKRTCLFKSIKMVLDTAFWIGDKNITICFNIMYDGLSSSGSLHEKWKRNIQMFSKYKLLFPNSV